MKKLFQIFLISILISSCAAGVNNQISAEQKSKIKNLGVYSGFDNVMHIFLAGAHQFDHTEKEIKMPSWWSLNRAAKETTSAKLKKVQVSAIKPKSSSLKDILAKAKSDNLDSALIIQPKVDKNNPLLKSGYGMVRYSNEIQKGYVSFSVALYDVKTGGLIKEISFDNDKSQSILFDLPLDFREYFNYHRDEVEKLMHSYESEISLKIYNALLEMGF
ncbi:MAG: hypothetical protein SFT90_01275 [Rickettsiales bacterium]|nr:hypothetical protein [Rickettsiales bacterium]